MQCSIQERQPARRNSCAGRSAQAYFTEARLTYRIEAPSATGGGSWFASALSSQDVSNDADGMVDATITPLYILSR